MKDVSRKRFSSFITKFFLAFTFTIVFTGSIQANEDLPTYGTVPDFRFTEASGKEKSNKDLVGSIWIADFIFTRCQGECPLISGQMAGLQKKLPSDVKLVSFTVDPAYDTPEVLSKYATRFGAEDGRWFFLTGDQLEMWDFIAEGFHLGVEKATPEDLEAGAQPVIHSNRFVLVDERGRIRGYYQSSDPTKMQELIEDALALAHSPSPLVGEGRDGGQSERFHSYLYPPPSEGEEMDEG